MYQKVISGITCGVEGQFIQVEADVRDGLPVFHMVGFLASEVKEAKERVRAAVKNSGFRLPAKRIIINLSPADLRKDGSAFDLPIAIAILSSMGYIPEDNLKATLILGELSLDGSINPIKGILPLVRFAKINGIKTCIIPEGNSKEGAVIEGIEVIGVTNLKETVEYLNNNKMIEAAYVDVDQLIADGLERESEDFCDIKGQHLAKRAIEIAAAGMHNMLMVGPPGAGKTMLARRIPSILPNLTYDECIQITTIYSVLGLQKKENSVVSRRPFRSPHHTVSNMALIGGGRVPKPGEISLAHHGVLFLDELTEYSKRALEMLRQPLEDKQIHLARSGKTAVYPADFMLVAAMNPCPCGYFPNRMKCTCNDHRIKQYLNRISHPLLDRIDINIEVLPVEFDELNQSRDEETSEQIRMRVLSAIGIQEERYLHEGIRFNSQLKNDQIERYCHVQTKDLAMLEDIFKVKGLSARGYHRILKVARTIADLEGADDLALKHLAEAAMYRTVEQKYWEGGN